MENLVNKVNEFSNYLLTVYDKSNNDALININGVLVNSPDFNKKQFISSLRVENENENQTIIENEIEIIKRSQLKEFEFIFGLDLSNEEVKNKVLEYLNNLLELKSSL